MSIPPIFITGTSISLCFFRKNFVEAASLNGGSTVIGQFYAIFGIMRLRKANQMINTNKNRGAE